VFYRGILLEDINNADSKKNTSVMSDLAKNIGIISYEVPWGAGENNKLDYEYLDLVYARHSIPLIAWKPWQQDSAGNPARDTAVMQHIIAGKYDSLLLSFASQVARLNKPLYLCFVNEPRPGKYPMFADRNCKSGEFIAAWQYVHHLFDEAGAVNVIWVWNPWNAHTVKDYFPGNNYVDWLRVDISDTVANIHDGIDTFFRPYHSLQLFRSGLPVMLTAAIGTHQTAQWWNATWATIDTGFTEIKSVIIRNTSYTSNQQVTFAINSGALKTIFAKAPDGSMPIDMNLALQPKVYEETGVHQLPPGIKNVVYNKGYDWFRNRHTMGLRTMEADIKAMKQIGINTLERTMPGIYDHNIAKAVAVNNMNLIPRFWSPSTPAVIDDDDEMQQRKKKILRVIKDNLDKKYIIAWNLGNDVLHNLAGQTYKPDYFYYRQKYITWLADLCHEIRLLDTIRPIIIDLHWDANGLNQFHYYKMHVPQINNYMLNADAKYIDGLKALPEDEMEWGKADVKLWPLIPSIKQGGTIPAWQDIETTDYVKLNGLLDLKGRKKQEYNYVLSTWGNKPARTSPIPDIRILKPAEITVPGNVLRYNVIYTTNKTSWQLYRDNKMNTLFEWYLVRVDQYGNTMFIKQVGEKPYIELSIPAGPQYYKLYLEVILNGEVRMVNTTLNTPLE
jgi:hypothetical protein